MFTTDLVYLNMDEDSKKNINGGDQENKEMVQNQADGRDLSLMDGMYDMPLPCFGCGIGWFSFLLGFAFPPLWYYATVLYFRNCLQDPRERPGLAASAIAALICSVVVLVALLVVFC